jgi:hypothetical protein
MSVWSAQNWDGPIPLGEAHPGSSLMVIIKCQLYGLPTKRLVGKP